MCQTALQVRIHSQRKFFGMYTLIVLTHSTKKVNLDVSVPFDEDDKDKSVWFLDHDYLENMYGMFKKVNGKDLRMLSV